MAMILRIVLACALWLVGVELVLLLATLLDLRPTLAGLAAPTVSAIAGRLPDLLQDLANAGLGGVAWVLERLAAPLIAQPERYLLIWSLPLVFLLLRWPFLAVVSANLSGGPPPWLEQTPGRPGRPPLAFDAAWKSIIAMSEPAAETIQVHGVFGEPRRGGSSEPVIDPSDLGAWWLSYMRSKGYHAGEADLKRLPKRLRLRRSTALLVDCSHGMDELRSLLDRLDREAERKDAKPLRILIVARRDLPAHVRQPDDRLLGLRRFNKPPNRIRPRLAKAAGFAGSEQKKGRGSLSGDAQNPVSDDAQRAPQSAPPFIFQPLQEDAETLAPWLSSQMSRAAEFFGADGWRIVLAGALLAPAPAALVDRLLPATTDRPRRRLLFELASLDNDSQESGLSVPGLLLEKQEVQCIRLALAEAVDRGGRETVQRFLHELAAEAPDRANAVMRQVLQPGGAHLPAHVAALFPTKARQALEAECAVPADTDGADGHLDLLAAAASRKFGRANFADWTAKAQLLLPVAIEALKPEGRRALLLEAASWEGERGLAAELVLFAETPEWLERTAALKAFLALLHNHRWRSAPASFKAAFPDLFAMGVPWARYAGDDEKERRFLTQWDILERFFQSRATEDAMTAWPEEQRQLCEDLLGPDPVLAMQAAWTFYWATQAVTLNAAAPLTPDTIAALIKACSASSTHPATWRRAAEALLKVAAPPPDSDFVYNWAVFADGGAEPEDPVVRSTLPAADMAPVVVEARARLETGTAPVRAAAAMILCTHDHALAGRAAGMIGRTLQNPGLQNDFEYLMMLRLAQCIDRPAATAELRRLFIEGLGSRNRAFLTLCGIRATEVLSGAIGLVPESEDEGYAQTVRRWQAAARATPLETDEEAVDFIGEAEHSGASATEETTRSASWIDRNISSKGHLIHKLKAKDTTGRWAYYFVLVEPDREREFLQSIQGDGTIDLEDFGKVIASNYGEEPSDEVKAFLKEKYGFDV